jgi:hypothetical protein
LTKNCATPLRSGGILPLRGDVAFRAIEAGEWNASGIPLAGFGSPMND